MLIEADCPFTYFRGLAEDRRFALMEVRAMIYRIWPDVVEDLTYGMPTYRLNGEPLCALANQKSFMAFYIMPYDLLDAFRNDLRTLDRGRSCLRFRSLDGHKRELFERIIRYTGTRHEDSIHYGRASSMRLRATRA